MSELVTVTGAAGFIAAHVVRELLERGYRVRGTVRRLKQPAEVAHLTGLPGAAERLTLVEADLMTPGAFDAAVQDATYVLHTASPYTLDVEDPARDLVDPARRGTENVLEAAARAGGVRRVVVTSSMAAITDEPGGRHVLTEADWNRKSSLARNPYYYSKTVAERAAWAFMAAQKPAFDLVVVNPFMVIGPSLSPGLNTSNEVFVAILTGAYPGIMNFAWGFVDVRDVALAHVLAATTRAASGRYICAADTVSMREVVSILREAGYGRYRLPTARLDSALGNTLVVLGSYLRPAGIGAYLRTHVGRVPRYDNGRIRRELGLRFRDVRGTIVETVADLERWGHLKPPAA